MKEDRDYKMLSHAAFNMLWQKYKGDNTKRYVICLNDELDVTQIEIWLKQVQT